MMYIRLFVFFVLPGCAITQQHAKPGKLPSKKNQASLENEKWTLGPERNKGAGDGSHKSLKQNPEHTSTYINFAQNNFQGVKNLVDSEWMKRKNNHEQVIQHGDMSRKDNDVLIEKVEQSQYSSISSSFGKAKHDMDDMNINLKPSPPKQQPQATPEVEHQEEDEEENEEENEEEDEKEDQSLPDEMDE